jgi:hypothetical protein
MLAIRLIKVSEKVFYQTFRILINPLPLLIIITYLSCLPLNNADDIFDKLPLKGENVRSVESPTIYYYDGIFLHPYTSEECYFSYGNPPFHVHYSKGGIRYVTQRIINMIPVGDDMCSKRINKIPRNSLNYIFEIEHYGQKNFLLANFSDVAHIISYFLIAISILYSWFNRLKYKYTITLLFSFLYSGILELIQHYFIQGRMADWYDMVLNLLGAFLGIAVYFFFIKFFKNRRKAI